MFSGMRASLEVDDQRFREAISKWISQTKQRPADVVLLVDASGSVSPTDFALGKQAASLLLEQFGDKTRVAIVQFASACQIECGLTLDHQLARRRSQAMVQTGGDTKTELAFATAREMLLSDRPEASKFVFLITDGHPDEEWDTQTAAEALKRAGVQIVGIGIGTVSVGQLSQFCSADSAFHLPSYRAFVESITEQRRQSLILNSEIAMRFEGPKLPVGLEKDFPLIVELRNVGDHEVPEGTRLVVEGAPFFSKEVQVLQSPLGIGSTQALSLRLKQNPDAKISMLPPHLEAKLIHPHSNQGYLIREPRFPIRIADFTGDLREWHPPEGQVANILVWGELGAGKSTLINSLLSLFSRTYEGYAISLSREGHVTHSLLPYHHRLSPRFRLIDSLGMKFDGTDHSRLSEILEGRVSFGADLRGEPGAEVEERESEARRIHAVIIIVSQGFGSNLLSSTLIAKGPREPSEPQTPHDLLNLCIDTMTQRHQLFPLLVVGRLDELTPDEAAKVPETFRGITGIPPERIFGLDNSRPQLRELERDKTLHAILTMALESCRNYIQHRATLFPLSTTPLSSLPTSPILPSLPASLFPLLPAAALPLPERPPSEKDPSRSEKQQQQQQHQHRAQLLVVVDQATTRALDVYGDFSLGVDRLSELREQLERQHRGGGGLGPDFNFVNSFTHNPIPRAQESIVPIQFASVVEDRLVKVLAVTKVPPPYGT